MNIVALISGRGSNLAALLEADLGGTIVAVISNRADARGLEIAQSHGITTAIVPHRDFATREAFDAALAATIDRYHPHLVVLAGFMRILTPGFVACYSGRMINIHPSLLPAFTGVDTHRRALDAGVKIHGCTVHFVTEALDHGPIIAQAAVPVRDDDNADSLAARVLAEEHRILPEAVRLFCAKRLVINGRRVSVSGEL